MQIRERLVQERRNKDVVKEKVDKGTLQSQDP